MTHNAPLLSQVIDRSIHLLTTHSVKSLSMLDAIESAMDDVAWPESDEETTVDDIAVQVERRLKARRVEAQKKAQAAKTKKGGKKVRLTAEEMEEKALKKAQKMLDRKARDCVGWGCEKESLDNEGEDETWAVDVDDGCAKEVLEWQRVLDVIDTLKERVEMSK